MSVQVLEEETWRAREAAHVARIDGLIAGHVARRAAGERHPVHDFMFTYYSHRPAQLRRWHPGFGVLPVGFPDLVDEEYVASRQRLVRQLHTLLSATARRTPSFGCFGLHEWAMVHRSPASETRHGWPLRLGGAGTDRVVESHRIACSHFDAFRFFTDSARPLNTLQPGRDDRPAFEQPGCLHGTMDLYKHAFRLSPMIPSELVADCFELAWDVRVLDMRAAPYDFTGLVLDDGSAWTPVRIETPEGKAEYVAAQRAFAARAEPLRRELIDACARLLALAG
ncbi:3-methyladenine DNA glycosylase [Nocardioides rotundus]|uniref:3-methyladenine DNA glycosylase n=1 Tax=Nocardioides rotundus TaxID=1774216 RepID=UPI0029583E52|nr:3-methyladenine DNA glycosylase [Nocardioides rotundus]